MARRPGELVEEAHDRRGGRSRETRDVRTAEDLHSLRRVLRWRGARASERESENSRFSKSFRELSAAQKSGGPPPKKLVPNVENGDLASLLNVQPCGRVFQCAVVVVIIVSGRELTSPTF